MNYARASLRHEVYASFVRSEDLQGRIHHVLRGTTHWKDSALVYRILSGFSERGDFVDFASGSGYMAELARRLGYRVHVVDASPEFRQFVSARVEGASVHEDIASYTRGGRRAEVVLAMHGLEHLEDPLATLRELRSATSDGGMLIAVVPNLDRAYYRFGEEGLEIEDQIESNGIASDFPPHHLTRFCRESLALALRSAGFRHVAVDYAPISAWELFHHGLGDEAFRYSTYAEDPAGMQVIGAAELDLNEVLSRLGLRDLSCSLVGLASESIDAGSLECWIENARRRALDAYRASIEEDARLVSDRRENERRTLEEMRGYIEDLRTALADKEREVRSVLEQSDAHRKAAAEYAASLEAALKAKDASLASLQEAMGTAPAELAIRIDPLPLEKAGIASGPAVIPGILGVAAEAAPPDGGPSGGGGELHALGRTVEGIVELQRVLEERLAVLQRELPRQLGRTEHLARDISELREQIGPLSTALERARREGEEARIFVQRVRQTWPLKVRRWLLERLFG